MQISAQATVTDTQATLQISHSETPPSRKYADTVTYIQATLQISDSETTPSRKYSRTPLIRPPSESHWRGRIRGMVAREGFVYEQKPLCVTRNVVV